MKELAAELAKAGGIALAAGLARLIDGGSLDDAYASMLERLSDERAKAKQFPDGEYRP